jgi:diguanylate cyclase (GGDEF)-like protein
MAPTRPEIALYESQAPSLARRFAWSLRFNTAILAVLLAISALQFFLEFVVLGPEADRYRQAARALRWAHLAMIDQETGCRGYLLTRKPEFLEPYRTGLLVMTENNELVGGLLAGDARFGKSLLDFRLAQQTWRHDWAERVVEEVDRSPDLARGKELFDAYRRSEGTLESGLDQQLERIIHQRRLILTGAGVYQLAIFALAIIGGRRRLEALRAAMLPAVATVLTAVRRVRDGRLQPLERTPSSSEFDDIQQGLDDMIAALARERASLDEQSRNNQTLTADLRQLLATSRELSGTLNLRYVVRALAKSACAVTRHKRATIWLVDEAARRLDPVYDNEGPQGAPTGLEPVEVGAGLLGRAARYGRTMLPEAVPLLTEADTPPPLPGEVAVPLIVGARVVGVVQVSGGSDTIRADALEMLEILASHAASAIESARLHQSTEEHSQRDALTQLYNRRRLTTDLDEEIRRCRRYRRPLSFIMLDVDHFKKLNDTFGHAKGDDILQELGQLLEEAVRDTDTAFRYGGEEFCILVRETGLDGARELAERLRARIETHFAHAGGEPPVTASLGVATFNDTMIKAAELVQAADRSLYDAKRAGRNRVSVSAPIAIQAMS